MSFESFVDECIGKKVEGLDEKVLSPLFGEGTASLFTAARAAPSGDRRRFNEKLDS